MAGEVEDEVSSRSKSSVGERSQDWKSKRRETLHALFPFTKKTKQPQLGKSLIVRKELYPKRQKMCDLSLALAIFGIVVMVINAELDYRANRSKGDTLDIDDRVFETLKWIISGSTGLLIISIYMYHRYDVKLLAVNYGMDDWRLAVTPKRILTFLAECAICLVHPFPPVDHYTCNDYLDLDDDHLGDLDFQLHFHLLLNILMFLRVYLIGRYVVVHSRLSKEASFQSLALLNRIHFGFRFILKSGMVLYPGFSLTVFISFSVLIMTWASHYCDIYLENPQGVMESAWLVVITFLTVGYGDVVPKSYCGRVVATLTGTLGVASTAFIVAILAQKMEFSRSEEEVHNFVLDIELKKKVKVEAANVIKHGWKLNRMKLCDHMKKTTLVTDRKVLFQQMKLMTSIYRLRELRHDHRRLKESVVNMTDVTQGLEEVHENHEALSARMEKIESLLDKRHEDRHKRMNQLESKIEEILETLRRAEETLMTRQSRQSSFYSILFRDPDE